MFELYKKNKKTVLGRKIERGLKSRHKDNNYNAASCGFVLINFIHILLHHGELLLEKWVLSYILLVLPQIVLVTFINMV